MVIPDPLDGHIYVLVSSTLIGGKMLETTIHEMIHAYDYYSFAKKYCGGNCTIIDAHPFFHSFHYYSEFHAKSMGLKIFSTPEECEFFRKEVIPYFDKKIEHYCESGSAYEIVRIISEIHSKKEFMSTDEQYELIRSLFANHNYEDIVKLYVIFDSMFDEYNSDYNDEINAICEKIYKK